MPSKNSLWRKLKAKLGLKGKKEANKDASGTPKGGLGEVEPESARNSPASHSPAAGHDSEDVGGGDYSSGPMAFAGKSIIGHRFTMEDQWCAIPGLLNVPRAWIAGFTDQLPLPFCSTLVDTGTDAPPAATPPNPQPSQSALESRADAALGDRVPLHFFAVYDGHGGADVAKHCSRKLHEHLKAIVCEAEASPPSATTPAPVHFVAESSELSQPAAEATADAAAPAPTAAQATSPTTTSPDNDSATTKNSSTNTDANVCSSTPTPTPDAAPPAGAAALQLPATGAAAALPDGAGLASSQGELATGASCRSTSDTLSSSTAGVSLSTGTNGSSVTPVASVTTPQSATTPTATSQLSNAPPAAPPAVLPVHSLETSLIRAFVKVDEELGAARLGHEMGTTAVVALLSQLHLWVANCGDSRAVLCRTDGAVALSSDHKATRNDEVVRVEAAGGYVWWERVMGELAVSRAIGDHCLRPFVIAEPEVTRVVRRSEDVLLLLASDGLWDVFRNEEAASTAVLRFREELSKGASPTSATKRAASELAKGAMRRGSRDNITVVVVDVRLNPPPAPTTPTTAASAAGVAQGASSSGRGSGGSVGAAATAQPLPAAKPDAQTAEAGTSPAGAGAGGAVSCLAAEGGGKGSDSQSQQVPLQPANAATAATAPAAAPAAATAAAATAVGVGQPPALPTTPTATKTKAGNHALAGESAKTGNNAKTGNGGATAVDGTAAVAPASPTGSPSPQKTDSAVPSAASKAVRTASGTVSGTASGTGPLDMRSGGSASSFLSACLGQSGKTHSQTRLAEKGAQL